MSEDIWQKLSKISPSDTLVRVYSFVLKEYYSIFKKEYYNKHHLEVKIVDKTLVVAWSHHKDYVLEKEAELTQLQEELLVEEFIAQALRCCNNCNFLIFDCGDDDRFVQFWLGDGTIMGSWPMAKANKLKRYAYPMLGVLNELGITRDFTNDGKWPEKLHHCYTFVKNKNFDEYAMSFGKDIKTATEFTTTVISEVFKQDLKKLKFKVG